MTNAVENAPARKAAKRQGSPQVVRDCSRMRSVLPCRRGSQHVGLPVEPPRNAEPRTKTAKPSRGQTRGRAQTGVRTKPTRCLPERPRNNGLAATPAATPTSTIAQSQAIDASRRLDERRFSPLAWSTSATVPRGRAPDLAGKLQSLWPVCTAKLTIVCSGTLAAGTAVDAGTWLKRHCRAVRR